jgi:hypothetical protein
MPALTLDGQVREVLVDVQKGRTGDVPGEVELPPTAGLSELEPAVHELVAHAAIVTCGRTAP